jgi:hypothetical protein
MSDMRLWWQDFRDQGHLGSLAWFALASYGIALCEWVMMTNLWKVHISDANFFVLMTVLGIVWFVIAVIGTVKFKWVSVVLWLPVYWGLFGALLIPRNFFACAFYKDCI